VYLQTTRSNSSDITDIIYAGLGKVYTRCEKHSSEIVWCADINGSSVKTF